MQAYQYEQISADPDKPLADGIRALDTTDMERLKDVQSMDELKDVYSHFLLYYGRDIPKMQNAAKANRKKLKRVREEGDEEGECWKRKPRRLDDHASPRMPLAEHLLGLLYLFQILGSDWKLEH